jgi:hypothetical protein
MFSIRKVKTKSGATAFQVVQYVLLNNQSGNSDEVVAELWFPDLQVEYIY